MRLLYPYKTLVGDVEIEVTDAKIDGHRLPDDCLEPDRNLVAIEAAERQKWETAKIDVEVTAPGAAHSRDGVHGVMPIPERDSAQSKEPPLPVTAT